MFAILQLRAMPLDYGITGFSATRVVLIFGMMLAVSMIPYVLLYISLGKKEEKESLSIATAQPKPVGRITALLHANKHPQPVHH